MADKANRNATNKPVVDARKAEVPGREAGLPDEPLNLSKAPEIGRRHDGRGEQDGPPHHDEAGRGSSVQGKHQDAKGGPMGANQGGAPRGGSRVEPSHVHEQNKKERGTSRAPKSGREPKPGH